MNDHQITAAWRRNKVSRGLLTLLSIVLTLAWARPAAAHPMGNYSINRYTRLELAADQIHVVYLLDMAELPTFQEKKRMDTDDDDVVSPAESQAYLDQQAPELGSNLHLEINGQRLALSLQDQFMEFRPGQGTLETLFIRLELMADLTPAADWAAEYSDENYGDRLGWWEVVTEPREGVVLLESTAPMADASDELTNFPQDLVTFVDDATFRFRPARPGELSGLAVTPVPRPGSPPGGEGGVAGVAVYTPPAVWGAGVISLAVLLTVGWGFVHTTAPEFKRAAGRLTIGQSLKSAALHGRATFFLSCALATIWQWALPVGLQPWLRLAAGLSALAMGIAAWRKKKEKVKEKGKGEGDRPFGCGATWLIWLGMVAMGQVWLGPLLLLAFGLGLFVAWAVGSPAPINGRWYQFVQAAGPLVATLVGAGLTWLTLTQPIILQGLLTFLLWVVGFTAPSG